MDPETNRFVCGAFCGLIAGVIAWALLIFMVAMLAERV
jgi:hypothetical protein